MRLVRVPGLDDIYINPENVVAVDVNDEDGEVDICCGDNSAWGTKAPLADVARDERDAAQAKLTALRKAVDRIAASVAIPSIESELEAALEASE